MSDLYKNGLQSTAEYQFSEGPTSWFLQDNDPKRRCRLAIEWKRDNQMQSPAVAR
jgi:hypothetical protein